MSYKILLVDDNTDFREELKDYLGEFYDVMEASSGKEAVDITSSPNEIALVIMDNRMPEMDGTEALRRIKKNSPDMKVILVTGYGNEDTAIEALRGDADDYLKKPMDMEQAKHAIETVLHEKEGLGDIESLDTRGKIERVKKYIARNCYKDVHLEDAAGTVYMSPNYLSKIFRLYAGVSFNQYRLKVKMDKARELLDDTGYSVNRIATKLKYLNPESFMRMFKRDTGMTPTEYRHRNPVNK